ncbi:hypothetical protein [Okeania sp. SIO2B3]|uniref:nSTAND1 domain-containing NTPase n=1 Tax=Okeania sp. SIO2B3 TaxID=2607784 RepID=UPI0013C16A6A|nr:hypothetical protein [Okeania sp. SIO2B3]NET42680.1 hypothetical protein [Okeania sp. SIO2B3]
MATQNNEKKLQQTGIKNQSGSPNYGKQIVIQNNFVINLKNYVIKVENNSNCPYKESSLLPEDDQNLYGRDEFVKELVNAVKKNNFVQILGESKSGKSSAILAGLVPRLVQAGNWLLTYFWPVKDPFDSIARVLVPLYIPEANKKEF